MGSNSTEVGLDKSGHRASTLTSLLTLLLREAVSTQKKAAFFCNNKQLLLPLLHGCRNCCFPSLRCSSWYSMLDFAAKADILFFFSFLLLDGRKISEVMREIFRLMGPREAYPKCEPVMGRMNRSGAHNIEYIYIYIYFGHSGIYFCFGFGNLRLRQRV